MDQLCLNPSPSPNPNHEPADPNLRPVNSTAFKREARKKRKERKRVQKLGDELDNLLALGTRTRPSNPVSFSDIEWPCAGINSDPIPETGWVVRGPNPQPGNPLRLPPPTRSLRPLRRGCSRKCWRNARASSPTTMSLRRTTKGRMWAILGLLNFLWAYLRKTGI
ncbi:uncharacterized protein A4U43_C05F18590 [Asparagus officinalis]|uniref:Uncharacterized protein n=1 Tax=Asparagus officinalis TaxID=4686 RepID=A0A5P1ETN6_ASPOF|nr:uncharacterized protein A4U43_C05F18590 [Asparagus officinalis]